MRPVHEPHGDPVPPLVDDVGKLAGLGVADVKHGRIPLLPVAATRRARFRTSAVHNVRVSCVGVMYAPSHRFAKQKTTTSCALGLSTWGLSFGGQ